MAPVIIATQNVTNKDKSSSSELSPAGTREVIVKKLAISPALLDNLKPVYSRFALSPCSTEAREVILNVGNRLLSEVKLDSAFN